MLLNYTLKHITTVTPKKDNIFVFFRSYTVLMCFIKILSGYRNYTINYNCFEKEAIRKIEIGRQCVSVRSTNQLYCTINF